jgi:carbon-monoxide dehydrogenase medium subunit
VGELVVAPTLAAALAFLAADPGCRPIAGGVGVMLARVLGLPGPERWVGIGALADLRERAIDSESGALVLGAGLTVEELTERGAAPPIPTLLAAAAEDVANPGIRVVATLGGNIVAGGAASDLAAALTALGTEAELVSATGTRRVAVEALCGPDPLDSGVLVRAFHVPSGATRWGWQRLTIRGAMDRSSASVALAAGERGVRIVATCVSGRPVRFPEAEAALEAGRGAGSPADGGSLGGDGAASDLLASVRAATASDLASADLLGDDRASVAYRRRVLPALVERAARQAFGRS